MAHVFTPLQNKTHSMDVSLIGLEEGDTSDNSDSSDSDIDSEPEAPPYSPLPSDFDYVSLFDRTVKVVSNHCVCHHGYKNSRHGRGIGNGSRALINLVI